MLIGGDGSQSGQVRLDLKFSKALWPRPRSPGLPKAIPPHRKMLIRILDIVSYAVLEYPMPQKFSIQGSGYRKLAYMTGRFILMSKV